MIAHRDAGGAPGRGRRRGSSRASGPAARSWASRIAVSSAALAIRWPRTGRSTSADGLGGEGVAGREQPRQQEPLGHLDGAVDVLAGVERLATSRRTRPSPRRPAGHRPHQQHVALGLGAERGPERRHQRHRDPAQLDPGRASWTGSSRPRSCRLRVKPVTRPPSASSPPSTSRTAARQDRARSGCSAAHPLDVGGHPTSTAPGAGGRPARRGRPSAPTASSTGRRRCRARARRRAAVGATSQCDVEPVAALAGVDAVGHVAVEVGQVRRRASAPSRARLK